MAPLTDISRAFGQQNSANCEPISRTQQYRKITKPLLERQRRARINHSLDELKELLVSNIQSEGENVARLEKADILELTVRHLRNLQQSGIKPIGEDEKFRDGFAHCAQEVSRVLATTPRMDIQMGTSLMVHLGHTLNLLANQTTTPTTTATTTTPTHGTTSGNGNRKNGTRTPIPITIVTMPMYSPISPAPSEYRPYTPPSSPEDTDITGTKGPWRPW